MEKYLDICDRCHSRELDFIFFDLRNGDSERWIKDVPGFRCRECGEILVSMGVIDAIDEVITKGSGSSMFPMGRYHQQVRKTSSIERSLSERYLHSWDMVRHDGKLKWEATGFRTFGDLKALTAI